MSEDSISARELVNRLYEALEALIPDAEQLVGLLPAGAQRDAVQARIRIARDMLTLVGRLS